MKKYLENNGSITHRYPRGSINAQNIHILLSLYGCHH